MCGMTTITKYVTPNKSETMAIISQVFSNPQYSINVPPIIGLSILPTGPTALNRALALLLIYGSFFIPYFFLLLR